MQINLTEKQVDLLRNWIEYATRANVENAHLDHGICPKLRKQILSENKMLERIDRKLFIARLMSKKPKEVT